MKKYLLVAAILISISTEATAGAIAMPLEGIGVETQSSREPGALGRTIEYGKKKVLTTSASKAKKIAASCLLSKKLCIGAAATAATFAYLYDHPEIVANYLERHPEQYDEVQRYLDSRKDHAKTQDQIDIYDKAEDDFNIITKTLDDQLDIETKPEFINELSKLEDIASSIDDNEDFRQNNESCSIAVAENLLSPGDEFNQLINPFLPKINDGTSTHFNVDKYNNLKSLERVTESDHIPSYKALEVFLINMGADFSRIRITKSKYGFLNQNATAINLPYATHRNNRTTGRHNSKLAELDGKSSSNLRLATLKDFATILYIEKLNANNYNNILKSFPYVYTRNKMLCLYDLRG